jgi:immunoglobulin-like protein involved in spore germination
MLGESERLQAREARMTPARRNLVVALVILLALGVGAGIALLATSGDGRSSSSSTSTSSSSSSSSTSPATTTTTQAAPADTSTAIFPVANSATRYSDPVAVTRAFATDFARFTAPIVGTFRQGDARSGEVDLRATATGPISTVLVRQLGSDGSWYVIGAGTQNIQVQAPTALAAVSSPVNVSGTSTAFEATVNVEVREDGNAQPLGKGIVMGGSNGAFGPFHGTLAFTAPSTALGSVVFSTASAEDGRILEISAVRVRFA